MPERDNEMHLIAAAAFTVMLLPPQVHSERLTDEVADHPGVTYGELMKQVIPDLAPRDDGAWSGEALPALRTIAGDDDQNDITAGFAFATVDVLRVREDGRSRILLLTSGSESDSFAEILAAFDDVEGETPRLLDAVDVGEDRLVSFGTPATLAIAPDTDLVLIDNEHSNSDQSYQQTSALFLERGKLALAASVFSFGERLCTHDMSETPRIRTMADGRARYRAIQITVTQETTLSGLACGDETAARPKPGTRVARDVFRWNEARRAYVSKTHQLEDLAKEDEKRF